jgi:hypothetical protein
MKSIKMLGVLTMSAVFAGQGLQSTHELIGGQAACDVSPTLTACSGSVVNSTGCGTHSVNTDSWFGNETHKAAPASAGACSDWVDNLNAACTGPSNIDTLLQYACAEDNPWTPW